MSIEEHHASATSSSLSVKASNRSKCRKSRESSQLWQQNNHLDVSSVITWTPQASKQSNCRFCFGPSHVSEVCPIVLPNIRATLLKQRNSNRTKTFGTEPCGSTNRGRLHYQKSVQGKTYHVPAQQLTDFRRQSALSSNEPCYSKQRTSLNYAAGLMGDIVRISLTR